MPTRLSRPRLPGGPAVRLASAAADCGGCPLSSQGSGGTCLCAQVPDANVDQLQELASAICFPRGSLVCEQGTEPRWLFIISRGLVKLYRLTAEGRRQIIGFLGPGDLLGGIKRNADAYCTAEAMVDTEACAFDRQQFIAFLADHPSLCLHLLVIATDEIEAQYEHAMLLSRKQASERLAAFVLLQGSRQPQVVDGDAMVQLPMPRADIADYLGLTIETVSRVFGRFKQLGYISFQGPKRLILKNLAALEDLAGLDTQPVRRITMGL